MTIREQAIEYIAKRHIETDGFSFTTHYGESMNPMIGEYWFYQYDQNVGFLLWYSEDPVKHEKVTFIEVHQAINRIKSGQLNLFNQ